MNDNQDLMVFADETPVSILSDLQRNNIAIFTNEANRVLALAVLECRPLLDSEVNILRELADKFEAGTCERSAVNYILAWPIASAAARSYPFQCC